jgi:prepilin-type processing-associated H-X9-DG protein
VGEHGDWRPAVDSLRPITTALWRGLSTVDRAEFLAEDASGWDSLRHRMAPSVAHALTTARRSGAVTVGRGQVAWAKEHADGLQVGMADGHVLNPHWVLNCTGPATDLTRSTCPLTRALLVVGSARPGELGIGLDTDDDGRLLGADGVAVDTVWTLGSLRRGQLWESTAIPELRAQAADLAGRLLKETVPRTPRPRGTRMDSSRSHTEKPVRLDLAAMR